MGALSHSNKVSLYVAAALEDFKIKLWLDDSSCMWLYTNEPNWTLDLASIHNAPNYCPYDNMMGFFFI